MFFLRLIINLVIIKVNNAAITVMRQASEHCAEDFGQIFGTNVESTFHLCQLAYPVLKESGNGSIVFISSVAGTTALPGLSVYGASKGKNFIFFLQTISKNRDFV